VALQLGAVTGLPVVHLDRLYWRTGWVEPSREEWMAVLRPALAEPAWIMDGNYGGSLVERLERADAVVWLDLPTRVCLWRALKRTATGWGRERPDMQPGCPERLDWKFLWYIAMFRARKRAGMVRALRDFDGRVVRVTSAGDLARVVEAVR